MRTQDDGWWYLLQREMNAVFALMAKPIRSLDVNVLLPNSMRDLCHWSVLKTCLALIDGAQMPVISQSHKEPQQVRMQA